MRLESGISILNYILIEFVSVAAGFPSGQYHLQSKILEVELTVADGATEIDIVISRAAALEDDWKSRAESLMEFIGRRGFHHSLLQDVELLMHS